MSESGSDITSLISDLFGSERDPERERLRASDRSGGRERSGDREGAGDGERPGDRERPPSESEEEPWTLDIDSIVSSPREEWEELSQSEWAGFRLLYKLNDDLRQDCYVVDVLRVVEHDVCTRVFGLRTHLDRYRVLPLSGEEGYIEFVDGSMAFSSLGKGHTPLLSHILSSKSNKINFVESLAAHCVLTYIMGVGDRHLDNLMITRDGRMFHVDYGYILGNDPKPFARVPMRLTNEMTYALGGISSNTFITLVIRIITLWFNLKKTSYELKLLFQLVSNTSIQDIQYTRKHLQTRTNNEATLQHLMLSKGLGRLNFSKDDILSIQFLTHDVNNYNLMIPCA
ncbi:putative phosphatidylinositol 3-kinase [Gregarina niphandrodes]|uniref:Phosphatidylinositol 3-kinase n=1 Tax=Gregarina niphandrodes TaxID=110365 RepID=A0A023B9T6_GRENI|nr:putative phosphatidylinositol 3-kinase [Gregarina niphandrodes]EZG76052.1 putative phosphatidylinositol 3-kinase [Gregarina niphandrodes]|eukprot:XP_011129586.1 putative phosphatidylinositol 3-kinase [Gregarina niphandrodes]